MAEAAGSGQASGSDAKKGNSAAPALGASLEGLAAIVTGSSNGVGAACAVALARRGCNVAITYNSSPAGAEKTAEDCKAAGNCSTIIVQADVSKDEDCSQLVAKTVEAFGRIDLLINNAGTTKFCAHNNLQGLTSEDFLRIYQTNTVSAFNMIKLCEPHFQKVGAGRVVNVASHAGVYHTIGSSMAYITSKAALVAMTRGLARALGPTIRVNAICPGFIEGEWLRKGLGDEKYDHVKGTIEEKVPLGAVSTPELVAENALWLLTGAPNITGEVVVMDAGTGLMVGPTF